MANTVNKNTALLVPSAFSVSFERNSLRDAVITNQFEHISECSFAVSKIVSPRMLVR